MSAPKYRWISLPPDFDPINATVDEVASYERCGRWLVHQRIRLKIYDSYIDGGRRKIVFASVKARRARAIEQTKNPFGKRRPGGQPRRPAPAAAPAE
jgi:hypothetical protein